MQSERKPRVDKLVPTVFIDWLLNRTHVATPDSEIVSEIEMRIAAHPEQSWTPALKRQTLKYALWRHHRNYADYANVMRGH